MYEDHYQYLTEEDELEHFGVLGMKWGVRRTKEKTPEQMAKSAKRRATAKKVAKVSAKVALGLGAAAIATYAGSAVTAASMANSAKRAMGAATVARMLRDGTIRNIPTNSLDPDMVSRAMQMLKK